MQCIDWTGFYKFAIEEEIHFLLAMRVSSISEAKMPEPIALFLINSRPCRQTKRNVYKLDVHMIINVPRVSTGWMIGHVIL